MEILLKSQRIYYVIIHLGKNGFEQLTNLYSRNGRFDKAIAYRQKYPDIRRKSLSMNHSNIDYCLSNIAYDHERMHENSMALKSYTEASSIYEKNHPDKQDIKGLLQITSPTTTCSLQ
jgi:tetratricopeptide (TPR) repeat protein